jgi:hypothetical protein
MGLSYKVPPWYLIFERQKISYFCILMFLLDLNLIGHFYSVNILSQEAPGEVVAHKGIHEAQTSTGGATSLTDRATRAYLALSGRLASVFLCTPLFR